MDVYSSLLHPVQSLKFQTWKFVIRQINVVQQTEQESLFMYPTYLEMQHMSYPVNFPHFLTQC